MGLPSHFCRRSERGTAPVGVLLLLMMMSALAAALAVSGQTETLVSRNHQTAAQARAAAEAGLNHAAEELISFMLVWKQNGFTDAEDAMNQLLMNKEDPAWLAMYGIELTLGDDDPTAIAGASDGEYHIFLTDEDDPDRAGYTTLGGEENDDPLIDTNRTVVIQAVGYAGRLRRGASVATAQLEGIISPYRLPAIAADGDLTLSGAAMSILLGDEAVGGAHANGDMAIDGTPTVIDTIPEIVDGEEDIGTLTATGSCSDCELVVTNPGDSGGNKTEIDIPKVRASDFITWTDYILHDNGSLENVATSVTVDCTAAGNPCKGEGWSFQSKSLQWSLIDSAGTAASGTSYVEGPVDISSGTLLAPAVATIIATGTISASGNNCIVPAAGVLLFVTDKDLELGGGFTAGASLNEGQMLVREQIAIAGNAVLFGQLVVGNCATLDNPCATASTETADESSVSGSVVITNTMDVGTSLFRLGGWREVR